MHRGFYVATVLVPLILGSSLLIFGIFTDYWIRLDYTKVRKFTPSTYNMETYGLKKIRFEFPKFSGLFDECNEYEIIQVLDPKLTVGSFRTKLTLFGDKISNSTRELFQPTELVDDLEISTESESENKSPMCLTKEQCNVVYPNENGPCFCCKSSESEAESESEPDKECCHPRSKLCDGVNNCGDGADELDNCPLKKVFYSHSWYDNKNRCQRHQYNFLTFLEKALNLKERFSSQSTDNFCLSEILHSENFTIKIFLLRLGTLLSFGFCIMFTILCLITILFVTCCHNLKDQTRHTSHHDFNALYGETETDEDLENFSQKSSCFCKCNCLLCPFVFYSTFSILAFIFHLIGLIIYIYSICYTRNAYLIFDSGFQPPQITKAYQYNPWLFEVQRMGISFYSIMASFVLYMVMFICSTCITCRIQMSPAWGARHTSTYEVLQMNDIVFHNKKLEKAEKKAAKKARKLKKKSEDSAELENVDEFSDNSGGTQAALSRPKTNIQAIDNSMSSNIYRV